MLLVLSSAQGGALGHPRAQATRAIELACLTVGLSQIGTQTPQGLEGSS
jgi:hypothetical protein